MNWLRGLLVCSWRGHDPRTEALLWGTRTLTVAPYCARCRLRLCLHPTAPNAPEGE